MTPGPQPTTPEGYLIQLYERFTLFMEKYEEDRTEDREKAKQICQRLDKHDEAIDKLNALAREQNGYEKGKQNWWQTYKEFIVVIVTAILTFIAAYLAGRLGA